MPPYIEKRSPKFTEALTMWIVVVAALGAFMVLLDPRITLTVSGQIIKFGTEEGFSAELKGAVITIMLIGGWTAAIQFWLGASDQGGKAQESVSSIAKASAPVTAAAVAAATGTPAPAQSTAPIAADTVNVDATTANITEKGNL